MSIFGCQIAMTPKYTANDSTTLELLSIKTLLAKKVHKQALKTIKKSLISGKKVKKTFLKPHIRKKEILPESTPDDKVLDQDLTEEALFLKMFGKVKKEQKVKDLMVPLIINGTFSQEIKLNIDNAAYFVPSKDIADGLKPLLSKSVLQKILKYKTPTTGELNLLHLHEFKIKSHFDEDKLVINITVPPHMLKPNKLTFSNHKSLSDEAFEKLLNETSHEISGVSNFYVRNTFRDADEASLVRDPLSLRNKTFINYDDYIFNGGFTLKESTNDARQSTGETLVRDYMYVSRDFPRLNQRYQVGEITATALDHMGREDIVGFSLTKHHDITRRKQLAIKVTDKDIFVESESRMEIFINDRLMKNVLLKAGRHLLSDFPLINGSNHVKVKITDNFGHEKFIDFDEFYYQELLKKGVNTFKASLGVSTHKDAFGSIVYDDTQLLSGNYNFGLTDDITLNNGLQIHSDIMAYESEFYWGSDYGLFSAYAVLSHTQAYNQGLKYGTKYKKIVGKHNFSFNKEHIDKRYKSLGSDFANDLAANTLGAQYGTSLGGSSMLTLNYMEKELLNQDSQSYKLSYNCYPSRSWNLKVDLEHLTTNSFDSNTIRFMVRYTPFSSRVNLQETISSTQTNNQDIRNVSTEVTLRPNKRYGMDASLTHNESSDGNQKDSMRARYSNPKYLMNVDYTNTEAVSGIQTASSSIAVSTALAFVGNHYAMSQPLGNSFILVENSEFLKENPIGMKSFNADNPSLSYVIPTADYKLRELHVEDRELIFGVDLNKTDYKVSSRYKSGTFIHIAPKFTVTAMGTLHDKDDKAVALKVFQIFRVNKEGKKEVLAEDNIFFTNKLGEFSMNNMEAGTYFIEEINSHTPQSFSLSIKASNQKKNMIKLWTLEVNQP